MTNYQIFVKCMREGLAITAQESDELTAYEKKAVTAFSEAASDKQILLAVTEHTVVPNNLINESILFENLERLLLTDYNYLSEHVGGDVLNSILFEEGGLLSEQATIGSALRNNAKRMKVNPSAPAAQNVGLKAGAKAAKAKSAVAGDFVTTGKAAATTPTPIGNVPGFTGAGAKQQVAAAAKQSAARTAVKQKVAAGMTGRGPAGNLVAKYQPKYNPQAKIDAARAANAKMGQVPGISGAHAKTTSTFNGAGATKSVPAYAGKASAAQGTGVIAKVKGALATLGQKASATKVGGMVAKATGASSAAMGGATVLGAAALAGLLIYGGVKVYKNYFSAAAKKCQGLSGSAKDACMAKARAAATQAEIRDLSSAKSACSKAKDPAKCAATVNAKIAKLRAKL